MKMNISIFGLGYVGSVSAACLAEKGHSIIGVDLNKNKVEMINAGKALIIEPQLSELTETAVTNGYLRATQDTREAVLSSDLSLICVGTPSKKNNSLDLQYVERVCEAIGKALKEKKDYHIIACRSTMFPGSMRKLVIPTLERFSEKKSGKDFSVCFNPEFMMEGTAVNDFYYPAKNIIGTQEAHVNDLFSKLHASFTQMPTICMDIESAELIKYCDNVWHALKVGYANEIGNVCKKLGIDSHVLMNVFCQDTKLNLSPYYLKPGFAFGGSCLPKDLRAFMYESQNLGLELPIINAILPSNRLQIENALKLIMEQGEKHIGILGFSFKADTDDLRESPMVEVIERLIGKGYTLTLYDKDVSQAKLHGANREYILNHIPHISQLMVSSIDEVLAKARVIVIGNKTKAFKKVLENIQDEHTIIDLVRINEEPPQHKQYKGICW